MGNRPVTNEAAGTVTSANGYDCVKRAFDIVAATSALVVLAPVLAAVAIAVRISSPGPVLFRQLRVGRHGKDFELYKFRSMIASDAPGGLLVTAGGDPRITTVGRWLRRTKLDELPQLVNVVFGEMSIVGPRPEVRPYVERFPDEFAEILAVRPGLTDLATVEYRDEESLLVHAAEPEAKYIQEILPRKLALSKEYVARRSFLLDCSLILKTIGALLP